jgi:hypothetical protein
MMTAPSVVVTRPTTAARSWSSHPRLTYAIAPPNQTTPAARRREIAAEQSARISALPIDALLVYDVQDEAARNSSARPFAFVPKVDPLEYAFEQLEVGSLPRVVYRAVAGQDETSLRAWLTRLHELGGNAVLVGAPCRRAPASLTLPQACELSRRHRPALPFGGVLIPERHEASGSEDVRIWTKMQQGCRFFVSQTVWSVAATQRLLSDLRVRCEREGHAAPPVLLTFSPCGSRQTLEFLEWLGVSVPGPTKRELLAATDMLARSIELAAAAFAEIHDFARACGLVVGANVESVTVRAAEVEASIELLRRIDRLAHGFREPKSRLEASSRACP